MGPSGSGKTTLLNCSKRVSSISSLTKNPWVRLAKEYTI
jgi:ABC-type lipoprotein export system ATPase subunit